MSLARAVYLAFLRDVGDNWAAIDQRYDARLRIPRYLAILTVTSELQRPQLIPGPRFEQPRLAGCAERAPEFF